MDIKKRILEALRKSRKTQQLLAVELGVSRGAVSDMLKKEGDPPLKYVEATAKITGVSADWILYGNDGQPANIVSEPGGVYSREHFIQKVKDQQQIIALQANLAFIPFPWVELWINGQYGETNLFLFDVGGAWPLGIVQAIYTQRSNKEIQPIDLSEVRYYPDRLNIRIIL